MNKQFFNIYYYFIIFISLSILCLTSIALGYLGVQLKLFIYGGTFYHDPLWDAKESMLTMGALSACASMLLYMFIYVPFSDWLYNFLFNKNKKEAKNGKSKK